MKVVMTVGVGPLKPSLIDPNDSCIYTAKILFIAYLENQDFKILTLT